MKSSTSNDRDRLKQYSLLDIIDIKALQKLQDSFAKANHVASSIADINGSAITKPSNHSPVCQLIRKTAIGAEKCRHSGIILGDLSLQSQKPTFLFCKSVGFVDAAAPIVIDGIHMANWLIGQNWIGEVDEERILSFSEEIGADKEQMLTAFREMDTIEEDEFKEKLDFLWLMANQISNQAYQQFRNQTMLSSLEKSQRELNAYKDNLEHIVNQRTAQLETAIEKIKQISLTDALTGCLNRGAINSSLPKEMRRAQRYDNAISIILCDLDHFKNINDTFGHQSGDSVLKEVVTQMQGNIRDDIDWLARYGGEEFLLVMPLTNLEGAKIVAERLRKKIEAIPFAFSGKTVHITVSFGLCTIEDWQSNATIDHEAFLHSADVYLYLAKKGGRNQVMCGPPVHIDSKDPEHTT